jgi:hypothetical protein
MGGLRREREDQKIDPEYNKKYGDKKRSWERSASNDRKTWGNDVKKDRGASRTRSPSPGGSGGGKGKR